MSEPDLFAPATGPAEGWPPGAAVERAYLEAFAGGSTAMIANLRTRVLGLRSADRIFPVSVNEAEYGDAYVCLPHSAYALYAKAELRLVDVGRWAPLLARLADGAGAVMRAARLNRIVHLDNWMLSTNLHGDWAGEDLPAIRRLLVERFPDHILAIRSLTEWSDAALLAACRANGWRLLPSRQVYVTDDLGKDSAPRRDTRRDRRLLETTPYRIDRLETLRPGDTERIAELYALLYLQRYSTLNPAYTAAFVAMTHASGALAYRGLRDEDGQLAAVVGCLHRGDVLTTPIVGYDTARPAEEGLYRMASLLYADMALERGVRLHGSAGAADFKRARGARPVVEYGAMFTGHLSLPRRATVAAMDALLNRVALPMVKERGL